MHRRQAASASPNILGIDFRTLPFVLLLVAAGVIALLTLAVPIAVAEEAARGRHDRQFGVVVKQFAEGEAEPTAQLLRSVGVEWIWGPATPSWREVQWMPGGGILWRARLAERHAIIDAGLLRIGAVGAFPPWLRLVEGEAARPESLALDAEGLQWLSDYARFVYSFVTYDSVGVPFFSVLPRGAVERLAPREAAMFVRTARLAMDATPRGREIGIVVEVEGIGTEALRRLLEEGVAAYIDAILIHWEGALDETIAAQAGAAVAALRALLARYGSHAELWVRLPGASEASPVTAEGAEDEAAALVRSHLLLLHLGFDRIWVEWERLRGEATEISTAAEDLPPHLRAYATLVRELHGFTYLGRLQTDEAVWLLVFSRGGEPALVGWTTGRPTAVTMNVNVESLLITDLFGDVRAEQLPGGRLSLGLSGDPVFVRGGDPSLIARALLDHGIERLVAPLVENGAVETAERVESGLQRAAIEAWFAAESEFRELRERAGGGGGGDPAVGWSPVAHDLGIPMQPEPNTEAAFAAWIDSLAAYLEYLRIGLGSSEKERGLSALHVPAGLPVFAELGTVLGLLWEEGAVDAQVAGSERVVAEARRWLTEQQQDVPVRRGAAERLLALAEAWGMRAQGDATEAARMMWSLVARETAALAVLQAETHPQSLADGFVVAAERAEVTRKDTTLALVDPAFYSRPNDEETGLTAHLRRALRPSGLAVPAAPDDPGGTPLVVGDGGPPPLSMLSVEEVVWHAVEIPAVAYRSFLQPPGVWRVRVEAPDGWMWQIDWRTYQAGETGVREGTLDPKGMVAGSSSTGILAVQALDLRILIPSLTPPGEYPVDLVVIDALGGEQRVSLWVVVR